MSQIQAYDIKSFCQAYSVSRSFVYLEFKSGRLKFFKAGRRTLISRESAERWQRLLEEIGSEDRTCTSQYPPDKQKMAVKTVLDQAKLMGENVAA